MIVRMLFIDACMPERCIGHAAETKESISMRTAKVHIDGCMFAGMCHHFLHSIFALNCCNTLLQYVYAFHRCMYARMMCRPRSRDEG